MPSCHIGRRLVGRRETGGDTCSTGFTRLARFTGAAAVTCPTRITGAAAVSCAAGVTSATRFPSTAGFTGAAAVACAAGVTSATRVTHTGGRPAAAASASASASAINRTRALDCDTHRVGAACDRVDWPSREDRRRAPAAKRSVSPGSRCRRDREPS